MSKNITDICCMFCDPDVLTNSLKSLVRPPRRSPTEDEKLAQLAYTCSIFCMFFGVILISMLRTMQGNGDESEVPSVLQ